jgi:nucleotidyltransferase/DNA polymerase involved in DNA repair
VRFAKFARFSCFVLILRLKHSFSADEAYLDVSRWGWDQVDSFAQRIKKDVETATGCPCSVGVGPNKLMARISTALAKPSGIHIARLADVPRILSQLRVADLPGVGNITAGKLAQFDVNSIDQLLLCSLKDIKHWVGEKNGLMLFNFARGLDNRPVKTRHVRCILPPFSFRHY